MLFCLHMGDDLFTALPSLVAVFVFSILHVSLREFFPLSPIVIGLSTPSYIFWGVIRIFIVLFPWQFECHYQGPLSARPHGHPRAIFNCPPAVRSQLDRHYFPSIDGSPYSIYLLWFPIPPIPVASSPFSLGVCAIGWRPLGSGPTSYNALPSPGIHRRGTFSVLVHAHDGIFLCPRTSDDVRRSDVRGGGI